MFDDLPPQITPSYTLKFPVPTQSPTLPPGTPPTVKLEGPWLQTQLMLASTIGLVSVLIFSWGRSKWPLMWAPRTKLRGFSPYYAAADPNDPGATNGRPKIRLPLFASGRQSREGWFSWIYQTLSIPDHAVLQIVGLDAAVLVGFYRMSAKLFGVCAFFAVGVLMPINWKVNKSLNDTITSGSALPQQHLYTLPRALDDGGQPNGTYPYPLPDWIDLFTEANAYLSLHGLFTILYTVLTLFFVYNSYVKFVKMRQLFSLELVHSVNARTVLVENVPKAWANSDDRDGTGEQERLVGYFEDMGLGVESVVVVRDIGVLQDLIERRTAALLDLESAWVDWVGNPARVTPRMGGDVNGDRDNVLGVGARPTIRPTRLPWPLSYLKPKVDKLHYLESRFNHFDRLVKDRRRRVAILGKSTHRAFVTFDKMSSAQIAAQSAHARRVDEMHTVLAPEPRDIVWSNMTLSTRQLWFRHAFVWLLLGILFAFWVIPVTFLASLLSFAEIKKVAPWLAHLIEQNERVSALVQNSLPSLGVVALNGCLPMILEFLTLLEGGKGRSWVEGGLLRKYHLFLLVNVVFIFLFASTYIQLVRDLVDYPAKIPEKLARALQGGAARNFFLSFVVLQALGIMPLQLLNLGHIIPYWITRVFWTKTPRDYAELNAPPYLNYGIVYPQALLMFTITLLYSVVQPLVLIFGALYFGIGYVVWKYKVLFVFYKPYESHGSLWGVTWRRCLWGVGIFEVFMIGFFLLQEAFRLAIIPTILLAIVTIWGFRTNAHFHGLSEFVSLSAVCEVESGDPTGMLSQNRATWSQAGLNRRRYAHGGEAEMYVVPGEEQRTDYRESPMRGWYHGVLNTGKRRYGHPAIGGVLPGIWLPVRKGVGLVRAGHEQDDDDQDAVVLTLRKRPSGVTRRRSRPLSSGPGTLARRSSNPWEEEAASAPAGSGSSTIPNFDASTGVIILPDEDFADDSTDSDFDGESEEEDLERGSQTPVPRAPNEANYVDERSSLLQSAEPFPVSPAAYVPSDSGASLSSVDGPSSPTRSMSVGSRAGAPRSVSRASRFGTYFPHPERRRDSLQRDRTESLRQVPGAFPR